MLSLADGSSFEIEAVASGGDLDIRSFDVNFDTGSFIQTSNLSACYCESVGDIPDPGKGGDDGGDDGDGDDGGSDDGGGS